MDLLLTTVAAIALGGAAFGVASSMFVVTRQQSARIVETFGKFSSVRSPGLSFKAPWPIQIASDAISLQIIELSVKVGVKVVDDAFVDIPIRAQFRIDENSVSQAYYKLADPARQIESYLINQVVNSAQKMTFNQLYSSKDSIEIEAKAALTQRMGEFGYIIENVLVGDPTPSSEVKTSFDRVLASKRLLEAAVNEGNATKIKAVAAAEAEAESLKLRGKALVDFRKTIAGGNAEAIKEFTGETGLTSLDALGFMNNINEMETLGRIGDGGGRVVFIGAAARDIGVAINSAAANAIPSPNETPARSRRATSERPDPLKENPPIENIDSSQN